MSNIEIESRKNSIHFENSSFSSSVTQNPIFIHLEILWRNIENYPFLLVVKIKPLKKMVIKITFFYTA